MDDLRWILLLVGIVVVAAIYFSGRFERESGQERKQWYSGGRKTSKKKALSRQAHNKIKKEPGMGVIEPKKPVAGPVSPINPHDEMMMLTSVTKTDQDLSTENKSETSKAKHIDIEDEIVEIEIPVNLAEAEAEIHITDTVPDIELESITMPPDIEPLVLSVSVFTDDENESFNGTEIKEALEAEGLLHGTMRIFHFHDPDKKNVSENDSTVFSVASVLEPGFFDLEKLNEMQTPGLMLFCQLPGPLPGEDALEVMLDKGRGVAVRLHGHMCDDKRNRFTTQAKNHYLDRITAFKRKLVLARKNTRVN